MAVNRTYNSQDGERKEDTCFVDITTWDKLAEVCAEHLSKGRLVFIEGRLQYQSWENDDALNEASSMWSHRTSSSWAVNKKMVKRQKARTIRTSHFNRRQK